MRITRANLLVKEVASTDKNDPAISGVHVAQDGTTVSANGRMLMAVEPVQGLPFPDVGVEPKIGKEGITIPLNVVDKALSNLPKDKRAAMQQAAITKATSSAVQLTTIGKSQEDRVTGRPLPHRFPEWEGVLAEARKRAKVTRVCINRRDLIDLLSAMDKACPDPGNRNAIFLELGGERDPLLVRAMNLQTGQHAVGLMSPLDTDGQWMPESDWETEILSGKRDTETPPDNELSSVPLRRKKVRRKTVRKVVRRG
jgi:hypothetical protein